MERNWDKGKAEDSRRGADAEKAQSRREAVDRGLFDGIMSTHSFFHKMVFYSLRDTGLTAGQPKLLEFLADSGPAMQKDLAKACGIEPSTAARLLPRMEDCGLIVRGRMEGNRRAVFVSLTELGESMADTVKGAFQSCEEKAFSGIDTAEKGHFLEMLEAVEANLQVEKGPQGPQETQGSYGSLHCLLLSCQALLQKQLFSGLADTKLTLGQPKILEFLEHGEGCQQKEIARACRIEPATVTTLLLNMENAGLIYRQTERGNRRSLHVYLTQQGRAMMERTLSALQETVETAFRGMEHRQEEFGKTLRRIRENLRGI